MNPELLATQTKLHEVLAELQASIATTQDETALRRILIEIGEVLHRINVISQLLFHQQTAAITAAAAEVAAVTGEVKKAIKKIDDLNGFLTTMTGFLGLVDKVIDVAKII